MQSIATLLIVIFITDVTKIYLLKLIECMHSD